MPQLLYIYIKNLRNCFINQEFSFTNDFNITFKDNKLDITILENPFNGFWGDKISNINLIVGKNGSGKTTLLDLLGSTKSRRTEMLAIPREERLDGRIFEEWFAVYHIEGEVFVIEGHYPHLIENLVNIPSGTSDEYSICIKYDFNSKTAIYSDYIQSKEKDTEKYSLDQKLVTLYLTNDKHKDWFISNMTIKGEQDYYVGYKRSYLNNPLIKNIYTFMSKGFKEIKESFTARNAICELNRERLFETMKDELTAKINLKLYKDTDKILLFKRDSPTKFLQIKVEEIKLWTTKEKFIIKFLESIIFDLWISVGRNKLNIDQKCIESIDSILFQNDNFKTRVTYLLDVLNKIYEAIDPELLLAPQAYDMDFIVKFINILDRINISYFITDYTLSFMLIKDYDEEIYNLFNLYDSYALNEYDIKRIIDIKFKNMSAGELEFVNGFSNLYTAIQITVSNKQFDTILLLLDEPDASFHPEWSRKYIYNIYKLLEKSDFGREVKFQILITTHSPFITSDIPKEHITCIDIEEDTFQRIVKKAEFGLMSNFYDIIKSDFFISSPIGEFAKCKFKKIIEEINELREYDRNKIEELGAIISSIGDKMIQIKLQQLLNDKEIKLLPKEERLNRISKLEIELNKLKNSQGGSLND